MTMLQPKRKLVQQVGHLRVYEARLAMGREFQVWGRGKLISRHTLLIGALKAAERRVEEHWDEIGRQLAEINKARVAEGLKPL
jgi:hypothetical protein